jgi:hypothetical protein
MFDSLTAIEKGFPTIRLTAKGVRLFSFFPYGTGTENRDLKLWVLFPAISGT